MKFLSHHRTLTLRLTLAMTVVMALTTMESSAQWVRATLPAPYNLGYYLDVFFLPDDPSYGWACSIDGYVVRTTDGGSTWRGSQTSRPFLESVQFLTPLVGYTSGPAGIYRSTDGGATWRDVTPFDPNGEKGWGCYFLNQNEGVYLVGGCTTGIQSFYRTVNGGQSWTVFRTLEPNSGLSDAIINRDGTGFAVSSGVLWYTDDFGRTWDFYSRTGSNVWTEELAIYNRSFLLPTSGVDCDGQTNGVGSLRFSVDGGRSFREFQTGANMFGTFLINETTGWGVGDDRTVYYTEDAGRTWVLRNCGIQGDLDDIWFINDTLGWIAGNGLYKSDFNAVRRRVTLDPPDDVLSICEGDSLLVTAASGFDSYTWADGTVGQARFLTDSGTFIVRAFDKATCLQSTDTVRVRFKNLVEPQIQASKTEVCEGDSVILTAVGDVIWRRWSSGDSTRSIVVKSSGRYNVRTLDSNGCEKESAAIDILVRKNPDPEIQADRSLTICLDEVVTLSAPPGFTSYRWSNGSTSRSITVDQAGVYTVTVVDQFGCVGTSAPRTVIVLNTRNKVEVTLSSADGYFDIPSHAVGDLSCRDVVIRNKSTNEDLVIRRPVLVGNVTFSIPAAQLPVVIGPLQSAVLTVCCAATDTGTVTDTIVIPDTCSPTGIPVRSYGQPIMLSGTTRCDVPASTIITKAGTAHQLTAPFPNPSSEVIGLQITPPVPTTAHLVDALGAIRAVADVDVDGKGTDVWIKVADVPAGPYILVLFVEGAQVRSMPVTVLR
jgi:photosystem II stability/assembly factor-like uncharacterized protein